MKEVLLGILYIVGTIIALYVLYSMPSSFLEEFEKSCHKSIEKRNSDLEEKEKLNSELRKWLFK